MNVRTALISSALLLAVLGWACEQQGPTSPSALSTPGGAAGGVSLDAAGGVRLAVDCTKKPDNPNCNGSGGDGGGGGTTFLATYTPDAGFDATDPTLTTSIALPTGPALGKYGCDFFNEGMNPLPVISVTTGSIVILTHGYMDAELKKGKIVGLKFWLLTEDGVIWRTENGSLPIDPPVAPSDAGFTLHVHKNNVLLGGGRKWCCRRLGTISIGDIVYTPAP